MVKSILYVLHEGKAGGAYLNVMDILKNLSDDFNSYVLFSERNILQLYKYEKNLKLIKTYTKDLWNIREFHNSWLNYVYFDVLLKYDIDIVHINHLINHSLDLPISAKKLDKKVIISVHDYYLICPYYTLINEKNQYCEGKCSKNNINCYNPNITKSINSKKIINTWRKEIMKMMEYVDFFITPSLFTKKLLLSIYTKLDENNIRVIEHGGDYPKIFEDYNEIPSTNKKIKILFPANYLNLLKGSNFIKEIKKCDTKNRLEFYFMGHVNKDLEKYGKNYGTYLREDFQSIVKKIKPSFIGIFSICPETFCYTLSESISCEIPILGTNVGVIQERIKRYNIGWILDYKKPLEAYEKIIEISNNKNEYLSKKENTKHIQLSNTNEMTKKYMELYNFLI